MSCHKRTIISESELFNSDSDDEQFIGFEAKYIIK